ncbi:MAG TPA: DUF2007 domain-containing protein [Thermoanaerobaculia bacterium]|nr:DUF2007 domain-containing protein [Thermoanaerobaculia bacterium]
METRERRMVQLYSPRNEPELLLLRSVFDDAGIRYFVRNDTFGSLYLGPHVEAYNRKIVCVSEVELDEASALLGEFLERTGRGRRQAPPPRHGLFDRLLHRLAEWLAPPLPAPEPPRFRLIRNPHPVRRSTAPRRRAQLRLVARR